VARSAERLREKSGRRRKPSWHTHGYWTSRSHRRPQLSIAVSSCGLGAPRSDPRSSLANSRPPVARLTTLTSFVPLRSTAGGRRRICILIWGSNPQRPACRSTSTVVARSIGPRRSSVDPIAHPRRAKRTFFCSHDPAPMRRSLFAMCTLIVQDGLSTRNSLPAHVLGWTTILRRRSVDAAPPAKSSSAVAARSDRPEARSPMPGPRRCLLLGQVMQRQRWAATVQSQAGFWCRLRPVNHGRPGTGFLYLNVPRRGAWNPRLFSRRPAPFGAGRPLPISHSLAYPLAIPAKSVALFCFGTNSQSSPRPVADGVAAQAARRGSATSVPLIFFQTDTARLCDPTFVRRRASSGVRRSGSALIFTMPSRPGLRS